MKQGMRFVNRSLKFKNTDIKKTGKKICKKWAKWRGINYEKKVWENLGKKYGKIGQKLREKVRENYVKNGENGGQEKINDINKGKKYGKIMGKIWKNWGKIKGKN